MKITRVKKMAMAVMLGASLCTGAANAGNETLKLVYVLGMNDNANANNNTYVAVVNPGDSSQCYYTLMTIPNDALRSARIAMLLSAKLTQTPVSLDFSADGQGGCVVSNVKIGN